ncbi:hypothetical protein LTS18_013678 [Coniosporium uncinatum]|uniref:Uncharacterized protein n=1 Tax=Coniosporium uncinatum TaxID=93489 RepID=A0ACC3CWP6_9PEZI|nr:hypothetical protein LTS18_013678 [Coniosporium uncinatum]
MVFGHGDGYEILRPIYRHLDFNLSVQDFLLRELSQWRHTLGLGLITPMLVMSRMKVADSVLPILPLLFFAASPDTLDTPSWPPSAALSFALLPYLRGAYNAYYEKVWGAKMQKWLSEIQPRAGTDDENANGGNRDLMPEEGDGIIDINIEVVEEIIDEEEEVLNEQQQGQDQDQRDQDQRDQDQQNQDQHDQEQQVQQQGGIAHPLHAPPLDEAAPAPQVRDNRNIDAAMVAALQNNDRQGNGNDNGGEGHGFNISLSGATNQVLGALAFPTIAALMGELLKLTLPKAWVTMPFNKLPFGGRLAVRPTGLLQQKWGRTLVGGCMFVALKDALMIYVRWKMARNHRFRRVLDYDRSKRAATRAA